MNCYILTSLYDGVTRQNMIDFLDDLPEVVNWRAHIGAIFLASEGPAEVLSDRIHEEFPTLFFIVARISAASTHGWADKDTWDLIQRPRPVGQR